VVLAESICHERKSNVHHCDFSETNLDRKQAFWSSIVTAQKIRRSSFSTVDVDYLRDKDSLDDEIVAQQPNEPIMM